MGAPSVENRDRTPLVWLIRSSRVQPNAAGVAVREHDTQETHAYKRDHTNNQEPAEGAGKQGEHRVDERERTIGHR
jgi:hypothetical protein